MTNESSRLPLTFSTSAGNRDLEQSIATARAAEAAGFTSVSFADRPHDPILDGWTLATAVAVRTERIRLFHATLNVPFRFPAVLAKEAATLDIISGGRLDLCLGAGGEGNRPLYDTIGVPLAAPGERLHDLRDAIAILRGMWTHERFSYSGRVYRVENANGLPHPVQGLIPIWVGARLPRSLRLAGELADGFLKNMGWGSLEEVAELNTSVDAAARRVGRSPTAIRRILNGAGYLAKNQADAEAYRGTPAGPMARGLIGTAGEILDLVRAYRQAGVDTFNVTFPPQQAAEQIAAFGAEVITEAQKL